MNDYLQQMETFARQNKIPVILPPTREFLCNLVASKKPNSILEIGMAIGFSASCMLLSYDKAKVVDLEASLPNIALAKQNFKALGLEEQVRPTVFIDRMDLAYACADVLISRAGASCRQASSILSHHFALPWMSDAIISFISSLPRSRVILSHLLS